MQSARERLMSRERPSSTVSLMRISAFCFFLPSSPISQLNATLPMKRQSRATPHRDSTTHLRERKRRKGGSEGRREEGVREGGRE